MENRRVNECFMKLARRAERVEREKLVATFVTTGPLVAILSSTDNQMMYGRRGTGKTHALQYLGDHVQEQGDFAVYVDMRTVGSNSSIYADHTLPISERATRLLVDVAAEIHDA